MANKVAPPTVSRKFPEAPALKVYAERTGLALWAWNRLHHELNLIFWFSLGKHQRHGLAFALWHATNTDASQRNMLSEVVKWNLAMQPNLAKRLKWLLSVVDKLGSYRNIAAHTAVALDADGVAPEWGSNREQARLRFSQIDHAQFWPLLTGDLFALGSYAHRIAEHLYHMNYSQTPPPAPLPRRPRVRSLPIVQSIESRLGQLVKEAARPPRRSTLRKWAGLKSPSRRARPR